MVGRARSIGQSAPVAVTLLLLANLVPLAGVLFFGWDVGMVLITYWLENGIVGLINIPKILMAQGEAPGSANRTFIAVFFFFHYGIFWIGHGVFVFVLAFLSVRRGFLDPFGPAAPLPDSGAIVIAALALLASHTASFFVNYLGKGENVRTTPPKQAFAPYPRMFVLHVTIIFSGFFVVVLGQPLIAVILLVVFKTALDLYLHLREHGRATGQDAGGQGTNGPNGIDTTRTGYV